MSSLVHQFLKNKPLYYKKIDIKKIYKAYKILKPHLKKPMTIHIVGTNGKGSTGRILATLLYYSNIKVGHYSSPHIFKFNERIWINGFDINDDKLQKAHNILYSILPKMLSDKLSYFEYSTLLALVAMQNLDVIVLEAGLGGEFDATNMVSKDLTIITPIGFDHQSFLGNSIKEIATSKLNAIKDRAILAKQYYNEVYLIASKLNAKIYRVENIIDRKKADTIKEITNRLGWSEYLYENTLVAIGALDILKLPYNINNILKIKLFGRFYPIRDNIIIDVGHNLLATKAIIKSLKLKFKNKKIVLVYNSLDDKDFVSILREFKPYLKRVEIIKINTPRAVNLALLKSKLIELNIDFKVFETTNNYDNYLVFGSFYVVEAFLKKEKLYL